MQQAKQNKCLKSSRKPPCSVEKLERYSNLLLKAVDRLDYLTHKSQFEQDLQF